MLKFFTISGNEIHRIVIKVNIEIANIKKFLNEFFFGCQFLEPHHMHIKCIDHQGAFTLLRIRDQRIILHFINGIKNTFRHSRFVCRNNEEEKSLKRVNLAVSSR